MKSTLVLVAAFSLLLLMNQVYGQKPGNIQIVTTQAIIDSLVKARGIENYSVHGHVWSLVAPLNKKQLSTNLEEALKLTCSNKLVTSKVIGNLVEIKPTSTGDSVLNGHLIALYLKDQDGEAVRKLKITVKGRHLSQYTDNHGIVVLPKLRPENQIICERSMTTEQFTHLYDGFSVAVWYLSPRSETMNDVIHTGFQSITRDQLTGAVKESDSSLFCTNAENSVLKRLEGGTPNFLQMKTNVHNGFPNTGAVRSANTLFGNSNMLVIVNDVPCRYPDMLNPNDVATIKIAADAAIMSLYGSRAANGVILITLKKPTRNNGQFNFNTSINVISRPNHYNSPTMSSADYLNAENALFDDGVYTKRIADNMQPSPFVDALVKHHKGDLSKLELDSLLAVYARRDTRRNLLQQLYRPAVNQQNFLSFSKRMGPLKIYGSAGYDRQLFEMKKNDFNRKTAQLSLNFTKSRWNYVANAAAGAINRRINDIQLPSAITYLDLIDENKLPLAIPYGYSQHFLDSISNGQYLDASFRPSEEWDLSNHKYTQGHLSLTQKIAYQLFPWLEINGFHQFGTYTSEEDNLHHMNSYYVRTMMNNNAIIELGTIKWKLPQGGILERTVAKSRYNDTRIQLNIRPFLARNQVLVIIGAELQSTKMHGTREIIYGYQTPKQQSNSTPRLDTTDNYLGVFGAINYTWQQKITLSGSIRKDRSNLYGPQPILEGWPFFSVGAAIHLQNFDFYPKNFPNTTFRASIGQSGTDNNLVINKSTIQEGAQNIYQEPVVNIANSANTLLSPERIRMINIGLDVQTENNKVKAGIDLYWKNSINLWGVSKPNPTFGTNSLNTNNNALKGKGVDVYLKFNYGPKSSNHNTVLWFSFTENEIRSEIPAHDQAWKYANINYNAFRKGYPVHSIYAFKMAPLDSVSGDPVGFLDNTPSKDYKGITQSSDPSSIMYIGSATPKSFACITHHWQLNASIYLQLALSGKFNYYYRRSSYTSKGIVDGSNAHADFMKRWQKKGDEKLTTIPSFSAQENASRDALYQYGDHLVAAGDHVRFDLLRVGWEIQEVPWVNVNKMNLSLSANNIGLIWAMNPFNQDPDVEQNAVTKRMHFTFDLKLQF